jgi:hypothetical protein
MSNLIEDFKNRALARAQENNFDAEMTVEEIYNDDFKAHTNLRSRKKDIYIGVNSETENKYGKEFVYEAVDSMVDHEEDHHGIEGCIGCPQTVEKHHDLFFQPMYRILKEKGFNEQDVHYVTNALEDTILHDDLKKNKERSLNGIKNFFLSQGENADDKKVGEFYEAHMKLNMYLWGTKKQKEKLQKYYSHTEDVKEVIEGFLDELELREKEEEINIYTKSHKISQKQNSISRIFKKSLEGVVNREDKIIQIKNRQEIDNFFLNENNWEKISEAYAKHFSKLMKPGYGNQSLPNHSGAGTTGRESEDSSEEGNSFDKEMKSKSFKKRKVMKTDKTDEELPEWIDEMEAMKLFYEGRAEQLAIKAQSFQKPEKLTVSRFGQRDFDPQKDNYRHIKFGIDENGKPIVKKKPHEIQVDMRVKHSPKSYPEIKFGMFDVSISMQKNINGGDSVGSDKLVPWGDNSKYHWGLEAQFGIFEYFRRNHLLSQNTILSAFFGKNTNIAKGFNDVRDYLLKPNFESTTHLDFDQIKDFFKGKGNLIYTIGDGQIWNWSDIKDNFIKEAKKHNYVHLHMGTPNDMTDDLESAGFEVVIAEDGKGIPKKMIDLTDKLFRYSQPNPGTLLPGNEPKPRL